MRTWLHGHDPLSPLAFEGPLAAIKAQVACGERYFERLLKRHLVDNRHRTVLVLKPDRDLAECEAQEERVRLEAGARQHDRAGSPGSGRSHEHAQAYTGAARHAGGAGHVEPNELESLIGGAAFMNLWGCAFEDLLTRQDSEGRNIVDHYLTRRGWKETATAKRYMTDLRHSVMSLYEVSDIVPGESFLARDLVRGGEPVRVHERSGSKTLAEWDRIGARLVDMGSKTEMAGGVLLYDRAISEDLLEDLKKMVAKLPEHRKRLAGEVGVEATNPIVVEELSEAGLLRVSAPIFSSHWLSEILDRVLDPEPLSFTNSDGDDLVLFTVCYPLGRGVSANPVRTALEAIECLRPASENFWNWIRAEDTGPLADTKQHKKAERRISTTMEDGAIVLGTIELKGLQLIFGANSVERVKAGREMLEAALGNLVSEPTIEQQTPAELMAARSEKKQAPPPDLSPAETRALVHLDLDLLYRRQLDEPIPMLGDVSPRTAIRSKKEREKVVSWIKTLENHMAHVPSDDPMAGYEFGWLWEELGIADHRR